MLSAVFASVIAALIERFVGKSQRVVHPDGLFFIDAARRIGDGNRRGVTLGGTGPDVVFRTDIIQREAVVLVITLRTETEFVNLVAHAHGVGLTAHRQQHSDEVRAERLTIRARLERHIRSSHIDLAVGVGP